MQQHHAVRSALEFDERNGSDAIVIDGWLYFSNGAKRQVHPIGEQWEPPEDDYKRCQIQVYYHRLVLDRAVEEFDQLKEVMMNDRDAWGEQDANVERLKELQKKVRQFRKNHKAAVQRMHEAEPGYVPPDEAKRRAEADRATQNKRSEFQRVIKGIEV